MIDGNLPQIVKDCRAHLQEHGSLATWLADDADFEEVYTWACSKDRGLRAELRRQPEVVSWIKHRAEEMWKYRDDLFPAVFWAAQYFLCIGAYKKVKWVKSFTANGAASRRYEFYEQLITCLRPDYENSFPSRRYAWVYLLTDTGKAAFSSERPKSAIPFFDEAWESRYVLPAGEKSKARAVAHIATNYAAAVAHLRGEDAREELFDVALDRLTESRQLLLDCTPDMELAGDLLNIGLSCGLVWKNRRDKCKKNRVGRITVARYRLDHFRKAEHDVRRATGAARKYGQPGSYDYGSLPDPDDRDTAARFLLEVAGAAELYGNLWLADECARKARTVSQLQHHRLKARLQLAHLERDRTAKMQYYEELLREVADGALQECTPWKQTEIRQQIADASRDLGKTLERLDRPTAAWFWAQQRTRFDPRPTPPGHAPAEQPAPSAESMARHLASTVKEEHVPGVVLTLMKLAHDHVHDDALLTPQVLRELEAVDNWRPLYRRRGDHLSLSACQSQSDVARVCAEVADEFARGYTPLYRPELLMALARNPSLNPRQRQAMAEEACAASLAVGRATEAISALIELIFLRLETGSVTQVMAPVMRVREIVRTTLARAWGTADLIDIAHGLTNTTATLAGLLAEHGCHELAFKIAHAPLGALSRAFEQDPELVEEFELAERWHSAQPDAERLLAMLGHKVLQGRHAYHPVTFPELSDVAACFGRSVSFVQLLHTPRHGAWALGASATTGRRCRYWSCRLGDIMLNGATVKVSDFRRRTWVDLRPLNRHEPDIDDDLAAMHTALVGPWLDEVKGSGALILIPHGVFSGLPLHAACGPHGYLIEQCPVGYLPNLNVAPSSLVSAPSALVGGWDPKIQGEDEARELEAHLRGLGVGVDRPAGAGEGRDRLLDPNECVWGLVHVVAHGSLSPWPNSSDSQLHLVPGVGVSAGDWLRRGCRATLVFLNACELGQGVVHRAGDLNGFPLALRARKTAADISALSPVDSADAHCFAAAFYEEMPKHDSLTAYYQACRKALKTERSACAWAPYVHSGFPVRVAGRHADRR
ncbi:CHAT domain-containing protein [Streptomyces populi]